MTDELMLLRSADPVPPSDPALGDRPLDGRALDELSALVSGRSESAGASQRRRRSRLVLAAAGVATSVALAFTVVPWVGGGAEPAYAATPPLLELQEPVAADASEALRRIATEAAAHPQVAAGPVQADGARREASWQSWSLSTRVGGEQVTSAVVPQESRLRWEADGTAALRVVTGAPYFPTTEHEEAYEAAGGPAEEGTVLRDESLGSFTADFADPPPASAEQMATYLGQDAVAPEGTAALFVAVEDLHREWTLGSAQRAALLEVLAAAPGVTALGSTTDRVGRPGEAFAVESDHTGLPTRYVLVVDPATGALLASEQWLTTSAGALDVPVPSVIAYTVWQE